MRHAIWKYPFAIADLVEIVMPIGARVIHIECQQGIPTLWAIVETEAQTEARGFLVVGTGHAFNPVGLRHIGTFQHLDGRLVWHVFEPKGQP